MTGHIGKLMIINCELNRICSQYWIFSIWIKINISDCMDVDLQSKKFKCRSYGECAEGFCVNLVRMRD